MKYLFLLALSFLMFASCSKNSNGIAAKKSNADIIVGTWHMTHEYGVNRNSAGNFIDTIYSNYFTATDIRGKEVLTADGMAYSWYDYNTAHNVDTLHYVVVGDSIFFSDSQLPVNPQSNPIQTIWASHIDKLTENELVTSDTGLAARYSLEVTTCVR